MSKVALTGNASGTGTITLASPNTNTSTTYTLPSADGTSGQVLQTDGSGALSFGTVQAYDSNLTSFVNTFTLPTTDGTNGQVLTTNGSGTLSLADAGGGAWNLITSVTASSASTATLDGIDSTYKTYAIIISGLKGEGGGATTLSARVRIGGTTQTDSTYSSLVMRVRDAASPFSIDGAIEWYITNTSQKFAWVTNYSTGFVIYLNNPAGTGYKGVSSTQYAYGGNTTGGSNISELFLGNYVYSGSTSAWSGIVFYPDSSTFSGTFALYGIANS